MKLRWSQYLVAALVLVSCKGSPEFRKQRDVDYKAYHNVRCRTDYQQVCVERTVSLPRETLDELIGIAAETFQENLKVVGVRKDWNRAKIEGADVVLVVGGFYSAIGNEPCCGMEEISLFILKNDAWNHEETYVVLYDPG